MNIITDINKKIESYDFLEFHIYSLSSNNLSIVGSDDLLYYHDFEILFINVHTILCNSEWIVNTSEQVLFDISNTDEGKKFNINFKVIQGNRIFKIISQDDVSFYIAAEDIKFIDKVVKYDR